MMKDDVINSVIGKEGGYVNNPADRGGPTNWGITQMTARAHGFTGDMRTMTRDQAVAIYEADYWTGPRFDQVATISPTIGAELMDTGVNMGPSVAAKFLQRWLNAFNQQGKLYPDMVVDGQLGPRSILALKTFITLRGKEGEATLLKALNCSQGARYLDIMEANPSQEAFGYGWLKERVNL